MTEQLFLVFGTLLFENKSIVTVATSSHYFAANVKVITNDLVNIFQCCLLPYALTYANIFHWLFSFNSKYVKDFFKTTPKFKNYSTKLNKTVDTFVYTAYTELN